MIEKDETNNAIIVRLANVRKHPNADRLKLATLLGTQVVVGLDAKDGDLVIYFDSNLRLSHDYLHYNNLYANKELNADQNVRGYFGKNGRVRSQKFRGEVSNGYVASIDSLWEYIPREDLELKEGCEFTSINGEKVCEKYLIPFTGTPRQQKKPISDMFHKHWDTKQLMRQIDDIPLGAMCYIEEKVHGTSGRTANVICKTNRPWYKFWKPKEEWRVVSGTRRVDDINFHLPQIRQEIENKLAPHLHKGEEVYYEIYGYGGGKQIQEGYPYDCRLGEFKVMLYRVTITTPDGFCVDMDREFVYRRAEELGLEKPRLFAIGPWSSGYSASCVSSWSVCAGEIVSNCGGQSYIDAGTLLEGFVIWFKDKWGKWTCLKHKSAEFLMDQDNRMEKEQGDVEDGL